ncbi:MAG: PAS domain-containing protein, partial [Pseudomonadota bacterium]
MATDYQRRRLALALDAAKMSLWDSLVPQGNVLKSKIFWIDAGLGLLGLTPQKTTQTFHAFLQSVHPDDAQQVVNTMQNAINHISDYEVQFRVVWPDLSVHWLNAKAQVIVSASGHSIRTIGL